LARRNLEADVVERLEVTEGLGDVANFDAHASLPRALVRLIGVSRAAFHSIKLLTASVTSAKSATRHAAANAPAYWSSLQRISTSRGSVFVRPRMWPETTETAPNSPMARALQRITP